MGFSRPESWSGLPFPSPGIFPTQGLNPGLMHCRQILYWLNCKGSPLVNANYRVLICCTCHFRSSFLFFVYFGFLCLQVSSVSNFYPDTRGQRWSLIEAHLFSCVVGRGDTANKGRRGGGGVLAVGGPHWACPRSRLVCFLGPHCSGSRVLCRGTVQSVSHCVSRTSQV